MKVLKILLAILLLGMVSCSNGTSAEELPKPEDTPTVEAGRTLVVFFSWSGHTRTVANMIQKQLNCDMVEIEVKEPYSSVYNEVTARARQELDNDILPALNTKVENMAEYDTLIVGTPIWGSHMSTPVKSFLAGYNLSGKTIVPFCTHGGSGTALSVDDIRRVCHDSKILQPLAIYGSRAESSQSDVARWLEAIGIKE